MALSSDWQSQVLGRLDPVTFLPLYPHSCVPSYNLQSDIYVENSNIELFSSFFTKLCYHISCPIPASFPAHADIKIINGMDPVLQLVKSKKHWEECKLQIIRFCDRKASRIKRGKQELEVPSNVLLLANHLSKDPDPYLGTIYNSYYNGSNISCLHLGFDVFLIRGVTNTHGEIVFSRLYINDEDQWDVEYKTLVNGTTDVPGPIYEIETTSNKVITRQKKCITLFSIKEEENQFNLQRELNIEDEIPLISVSAYGTKFCSLSVERDLKLFDTTVGCTFIQEKLDDDEEIKSDRWGSINFLNENTLSFLDRSSCSLVDLRVKTDVVKKWTIKEITEHCEEIYGGKPGQNDLQYLTTSHQVLSLDFRMGFSQRWTHGIGHSPALVSTLTSSSLHDLLFIGSQRNDTVVFLQNQWMGNKPLSKVVPYAIPSLRDTFHLSRYYGCSLSNTVSSRFNLCLTGLCCLENQGNITLFRTTSIGDVFKQTLIKGSEEDLHLSESELNKLEEWGELCEDLLIDMDYPCFATDVLDDSNILQCIQSNGKLYEEPLCKNEFDFAEWKVSKKDLANCCDYLAPRILEEWCIDEEEEWCHLPEKTIDEMSSDDEEDVTERVTKWIEKYAADMGANPTRNEDGYEETSEVREKDSTFDVTLNQICNIEKDSIVNCNSNEPFSQKLKITTSTPRKKFISGF